MVRIPPPFPGRFSQMAVEPSSLHRWIPGLTPCQDIASQIPVPAAIDSIQPLIVYG